MFIYATSEQCDLVPIYTTTNTHRIRIYPGKLKFIWSKFHWLQDKDNQTDYSHFLLLTIYPDSPVQMSANTESIQICSVMGKCFYTVI